MTSHRRFRSLLALTTLGALSLFCVGCETDPATGFVQSCLTFVPEMETPTSGEVTAVWGADSTCDQMEVELYIADVNDIWSVSFELEFPEALAFFAAATFGDSFLREDGNPLLVNTEVQFQDIDNDMVDESVLIGSITRTDSSSNTGVDAVDTSVSPEDASLIIRLIFFRLASAGSGEMIFHDTVIEKVENLDDLPTDVTPPVVFSAGNVVIEN